MHKKNIKKGFFVNNKKNILILAFFTILTSLYTCIGATAPAESSNLQESTSTDNTTPQKKVKKQKNRLGNLIKKVLPTDRCPYSNTPLKKLKIEHLEEVYAYTQTHKMDAIFMINLLERLIALSDNHAGVKQYKLQLAETHYQAHNIEKAAAYYEDFGVMYPGSNENEYVLYKAVACMFELSLDCDRDQTNTKKTIALIKEFLKRAKTANLIEQANSILQQCYDRLYDHEVYVFNFYRKKKNFVAAQKRLDYIIKTFTHTVQDLNNKVTALADQLELSKHPVKPSKKYLTKKFLA